MIKKAKVLLYRSHAVVSRESGCPNRCQGGCQKMPLYCVHKYGYCRVRTCAVRTDVGTAAGELMMSTVFCSVLRSARKLDVVEEHTVSFNLT